jgi:TolB-like protein
MAEDDRFGKDVKLRSGNVASRILPIRIHDLESEDVKLFEKETGSVLRALDFVFKTATGAIRPLLPNEDHPNDNLYKTFYRDQISKVGIAIKEIILSMKKEPVSIVQGKVEKSTEDVHVSEGIEQGKTARFSFKSRKLLWLVGSFLLIMVGAIAIYSVLIHRKDTRELTNLNKSIAVLPFVNDSPDEDNSHLINGLMDEILINLQLIHDLTVISRNSVEQFHGDNKLSTPVIAKKLGVNYIIEGSGQKYGNSLRLRVQLIAVSKGKERHLWGKIYDNEVT